MQSTIFSYLNPALFNPVIIINFLVKITLRTLVSTVLRQRLLWGKNETDAKEAHQKAPRVLAGAIGNDSSKIMLGSPPYQKSGELLVGNPRLCMATGLIRTMSTCTSCILLIISHVEYVG